MSDKVANMQKTFSNVLEIYRATASMLEDADDLMREDGYECLRKNLNIIGTEQSKSIRRTALWSPPFAARYYQKRRGKDVRGIGVVFIDKDAEEAIEPMILMAAFWEKIYGRPEVEYALLWDAWSSLENRPVYEETVDFNEVDEDYFGKIQAVGLGAINNLTTLRKLVVNPLLKMEKPSST